VNFVAPIRHDPGAAPSPVALDSAISSATAALLGNQHDDGHWCFELEADATIPAEYILLRHFLGEPDNLELEAKMGRYLRSIQGEHGGWPLFHGGAFDVSASVKAYFALKMIGDDPAAPHMAKAREAILAHGGAGTANVFTRIQLALFGEMSWNATPSMPVEMILLPRWFPIHLGKMSYWARTVLAPLLVVMAIKPKARNPRAIGVQELFAAPGSGRRKAKTHVKRGWAALFKSLDVLLKQVDPHWPTKLRARAIERAVEFTRERLNGEDGLGGIYPAMANSVMMFDALGYEESHPDRATARGAIEKLLVVDEEKAYLQPCVSPVWDTALAAHALLETGDVQAEQAVVEAMRWLKPRQILDVKGDWVDERPGLRPGGWAFQYNNAHYPDTDDTAAVVLAMDRLRPKLAGDAAAFDEPVARAREWIEGMQSRNGGWGAFDADNTYDYLNNIPFADHGALLDPPTVDVSARCIGMLAQLGEPSDSPRMKAALAYLERDQLPDGSWFGRWGVNYVYGTWSALCALNAAGADLDGPVVQRAVEWLCSVQNPDGGWGEDCDSYRLDYDGYVAAPSTPSQTAWALLGLMAAGAVETEAVERGIRYLAETQAEDGLWPQDSYTGGGFPRVFYLRYHGYPKYFPLWAMARYRNLKRSNTQRVPWGI
jgi:squalene-hopene/tetraprenyl-beta-curcumene cyclase